MMSLSSWCVSGLILEHVQLVSLEHVFTLPTITISPGKDNDAQIVESLGQAKLAGWKVTNISEQRQGAAPCVRVYGLTCALWGGDRQGHENVQKVLCPRVTQIKPALTYVGRKVYTSFKNQVQISIFYVFKCSSGWFNGVRNRIASLFTSNLHAEKVQLSEIERSLHAEHLPAICVNTHATRSSASLLRSVVILPEGVEGGAKSETKNAYGILLFNLNHVVL